MVNAKLSNTRHSPRKMRIVAELVKGKKVSEALMHIDFLPKRAGATLGKLIRSAVANAKNNFSLDADTLYVKDIRVDAGVVLKRSMPRARGSAFPIKKRTSHVLVTLAPKAPKAK